MLVPSVGFALHGLPAVGPKLAPVVSRTAARTMSSPEWAFMGLYMEGGIHDLRVVCLAGGLPRARHTC